MGIGGSSEIYCDKCGKQIKFPLNNRGFHIFRNRYFLKNSSNDEWLDLCQDCYDELKEFMKEGKKKNE